MTKVEIKDVEEVLDSEIKKSGQGAIAYAKKKFIGRKAKLVILKE